MFEGAYTALVTPFKNDKIDYDLLTKAVKKRSVSTLFIFKIFFIFGILQFSYDG